MEESQDKGLQSASEHIFSVPRHGSELETARPSTLRAEEVSKDKGCQPQSKQNPSIPRHGAALVTARPSTLRVWCGAGNGTHRVTINTATWCGAGNGTHRVTRCGYGAALETARTHEEEQEQADLIEAAQDLAAHFGTETSSTFDTVHPEG